MVNPIQGKCVLLALPNGESYRSRLEADFGQPVPIGEPINQTLETSALYTY